MDNLTHATEREAARCARCCGDRNTWIISLLYIGTFGSFIGFGFAFGQVLQIQFHGTFDTPMQGGGADVPRPAARLADPPGRRARWPTGSAARRSSAASTSSPWPSVPAIVLAASRADSLPLFLTGFIVLFVLTGIGNGSVYKMIPAIFRAKAALAVAAGAPPCREPTGWPGDRRGR